MNTRWPLVFAALAVVAALLAPAMVGGTRILRVASLFYVAMVLMAGLHLICGLSRTISLCHASLVGVGAYVAGIVTTRHEWPPILAVAASVVCAAICGLLVAAATRRLDGHYLTLATLAVSEILTSTFMSATSVTGGPNGISGIPPLRLGQLVADTPARYYPVCAILGLGALAVVRYVDRSALGRALSAVGDVGARIETLGASESALRTSAFVMGAAFAGLAGSVQAHVDSFVGPESFGVSLSTAYLCFLVIGGLGHIRSVVIGAAFLSIGPEVLHGLHEMQMVVVAALALATLVWDERRRKLIFA